MKKKRLYLYSSRENQNKPAQLIAQSSHDAKIQLLQQGIIAHKIQAGPILSQRHLTKNALMLITRQLGMMLQAGLPLLSTLQLIADEHPNPCWRYIFSDLQKVIASGEPFSTALSHYPEAFPRFYREMIQTAELSGQLDRCCFLLAAQQEKAEALRQKIKKATRYPLFVLSVAIVVIMLILVFVLPKFSQLYADFGSELPAFTQSLISFSHYLRHNGLLTLAILALLTFGYLTWCHPRLFWQQQEQALLFRLPLVKKLMHLANLTVLFQTLSLTQQSGISLLNGLQAAGRSVPHQQYQSILTTMIERLNYGMPLSECFQSAQLFPALSIQLLRIGETSGTLDLMLEKLTEIYQQQAEEAAETLTQQIEPLMMCILGLIVGGLVVAIYLPILQVGQILG